MIAYAAIIMIPVAIVLLGLGLKTFVLGGDW